MRPHIRHVLALALAVAAVRADAYISHQCEQEVMRYFAGASRTYRLPQPCIPGGLPPDHSNAVRRIVGDTRLSFVGTFDAVARRALASAAFGTAECTYNQIYSPTGMVVRPFDQAYWRSPAAIAELFPDTLHWRAPAERDYAITNVTVGGQTIPDSVRILNRFLSGLHWLHPSPAGSADAADPWALTYLVYPRPTQYSTDPEVRWPELNSFHLQNLPSIPKLLGWGFSSATNVAEYGDFDTGWKNDLAGLLGGRWWKFFATTWDIFELAGPQMPRRIEEDIWVDDWRYFGFPSRYPDRWQSWRDAMHGFPSGHGHFRAGIRAIADTIGYPGFNLYATNSVELLPGTPLHRRIEWLPWAKSNGLIALTDTALVGREFMPQLRYKYTHEEGEVTVDFETETFFAPAAWHHDDGSWVGAGAYYSIVPSNLQVTAASILGTNSVWAFDTGYEPFRLAMVDWDGLAAYNLTLMDVVSETYNVRTEIGQSKIYEWAESYFSWTQCPTGTVFAIYTSPPVNGIYDIWGQSSAWGDWPVGYANFQDIPVYWRFESSVSVGAKVDTTTARMDYDRRLLYAETNSVPCVYPHPSYDVDAVDYAQKIDANALLCVASSTNSLAIHGDGYGNSWTGSDFKFRMMSGNVLTAAAVDGWFAAVVDRALEDMVADGPAGDVRAGHAALIPKLEEWVADSSGDPNRPIEQRLLNDWTTNNMTVYISMKLPAIQIRIDQIDPSAVDGCVRSATALDMSGNPVTLPLKWTEEVQPPGMTSYGKCPFSGGATCGSSTGLGAVHWDFKAMRRVGADNARYDEIGGP